jgi:hypothetical protein
MAVERLFEALLVKCVPNETNAPGQHKKAIEVANVNDFINFLLGEHGTAGQQVQEERTDTAIHIHDQVVGFGQSVRLHSHSILHVLHCWEMCPCIPLQKLHSLVTVVSALDPIHSISHSQVSKAAINCD